MLFNRIVTSIFLIGGVVFASQSQADVFGEVLNPGESMQIWNVRSQGVFDCGYQLQSVTAKVEYNDQYWGVLALVLDNKEADRTHIRLRQESASLRTFGNLNVLCEDIQTVSVANVGKDPIFVGNTRMHLGARSRD
ncbi:hypothetical protein GW915_11480 [bacterium]|nr:hypothetical protein [bacterium]